MKEDKKTTYLILENIRSVQNVGAIFRTADACGIDKIFLCGYTSSPLDRFNRKRSDLAKAALGAEDHVGWESIESSATIISKLKEEGFFIIGIEQAAGSVDYKEVDISEKEGVVFILGNEVTGIEKETLEFCDMIAEIPMMGTKESLNVSVAAGIVLFRVLNI